ncbi:MAG: acyl-CoA dehydrogenase family protein, partial [Candidatus Nanopelagicaceae bacterium]
MDKLFSLPEEYQALRESVRALAEKKIAPFAKEVDEEARYPKEAEEALQGAGLAAAHVPTEFGGDGADALAVVIIIEEVARVCGASSLIPAVNKLGSWPLILAGSEAQKKRWLPELARGRGFSYCLSESESGSDSVAMKTKAVRDGAHWILSGSKKWISNAGVSDFYTVLAVTDPAARSKGITAFIVEKSDPGISFGAHEKKMGMRGSPTREVYFDGVVLDESRVLGEV